MSVGDEPSAEALLLAMAATLSDQVVPAASGGAAHAARVVANLCRILAREAADPGDGRGDADLLALLDRTDLQGTSEATPDGLIRALDDRLRGGDADFAVAALPVVRRDVERRLRIAKPSYLEDRT